MKKKIVKNGRDREISGQKTCRLILKLQCVTFTFDIRMWFFLATRRLDVPNYFNILPWTGKLQTGHEMPVWPWPWFFRDKSVLICQTFLLYGNSIQGVQSYGPDTSKPGRTVGRTDGRCNFNMSWKVNLTHMSLLSIKREKFPIVLRQTYVSLITITWAYYSKFIEFISWNIIKLKLTVTSNISICICAILALNIVQSL